MVKMVDVLFSSRIFVSAQNRVLIVLVYRLAPLWFLEHYPVPRTHFGAFYV